MQDHGPVRYMRKSFDCINDYPPPQNGETVTEWIDRLHANNISVNRMDILDWFWPSVALNLNYEDKEALLARIPGIQAFCWAGRVYVSNTDDLMVLRLSADEDVVHTPRPPLRSKE